MLEKPDFPDAKIINCLQDEYGLKITHLDFLPLGADRNTTVYRAADAAGVPYFVKLRGEFDAMTVIIPNFLHEQGIREIIAPLANQSGQLWSNLDEFNLILYPFIEGQGGFDVDLADQQWVEFGRALKAIHTVNLPPDITGRLQREMYSPYWRELVRGFQAQVETKIFSDPVAAKLAALMQTKRLEISDLVNLAEQLGALLQAQSPELVLCHTDIHVGNILLAEDGRIYIVDWDNPLLAPKERDLMFIGGGLGGGGHTPDEEVALFYQGYGQTQIDPVALIYYRYERIVQDIAAYCEQLLLTDAGGADREEGLRQLMSQFEPGGVIELAYRTEKYLPAEYRANSSLG